VGAGAFAVDLALFVTLLGLAVPVLAAATIGFIAGTFANNRPSRLLAFTGGRLAPAGEVVRLFVVALGGLALTTFLVWLFHARLAIPPVAARCAAGLLVFAWNLLGR
jgi:putative flippase GtrA